MSPSIHTYYIKNMLCHCCLKFLNLLLKENHYQIIEISLGKVTLSKNNFSESGFPSTFTKIWIRHYKKS